MYLLTAQCYGDVQQVTCTSRKGTANIAMSVTLKVFYCNWMCSVTRWSISAWCGGGEFLQLAVLCCWCVQAIVDHDDSEEAFLQLQQPLSAVAPAYMPALLQPLVVLGPFGSGKRLVLQQLMKLLPDVLAVPRVVTTHETATAGMWVYGQAWLSSNKVRDA